MGTWTENKSLKAVLAPLQVLIHPMETFRELAQNPSLIGLGFLVGLILATTAITQFVTASKIFFMVDDQFISVLASNVFSMYMVRSLVDIVFVLFGNWLVYAGAMFLLMRAFGESGASWRPFLVLVGYTFSVFIIRSCLTAALFSTLPDLRLNINTWPPETTESYDIYTTQFHAVWEPTFALLAVSTISWLFYAWSVILGVYAVHASKEMSWKKAGLISISAYLINLVLSLFLPVLL